MVVGFCHPKNPWTHRVKGEVRSSYFNCVFLHSAKVAFVTHLQYELLNTQLNSTSSMISRQTSSFHGSRVYNEVSGEQSWHEMWDLQKPCPGELLRWLRSQESRETPADWKWKVSWFMQLISCSDKWVKKNNAKKRPLKKLNTWDDPISRIEILDRTIWPSDKRFFAFKLHCVLVYV